jgi:hypothetical protein
MFAGVVSAASGIEQVPVIAPAVIEHGNAVGALRPPPPVAKAIAVPLLLTGVKVTVPALMGSPPMLMLLAVIVVICAEARGRRPNAHRSAAAALSSRFIGVSPEWLLGRGVTNYRERVEAVV